MLILIKVKTLLYFNKSKSINGCQDLDIKLCGVTIPVKQEVNYSRTILRSGKQLHNAEKTINDMKTRSDFIISEFRSNRYTVISFWEFIKQIILILH